MSIHVKWGKERLHIVLPSPDPKLGTIRESLAEYSHVPIENIKLIYGGGIMKDDSYPISMYGIQEGSTIHMVGSTDRPPSRNASSPVPKPPPSRPTESDLIRKIQAELHKTRESLIPPLDLFLTRTASSPAPRPELEKEHMRLGELLLQSLLRLDALTPEGTWEDARSQRRGAVREVQGMLDKLDNSWQGCKDNAH
ncbi:hypothetical protein Clacol_000653 [Clathrus columnatus]|uniref:BAG family molecular chaperone regulator 1 n=1 Tax=Clathrus columnatus TaxID=1419009 RepID=A0AAV5A0A8_9AGAM|nr:hypothetical protein Clacol_000653 [Clathrus columnatus]